MKIYTKTGDKGTTALFSGGRVAKDHLRVAAYGTVDELNSAIGLARAHRPAEKLDQWLAQIQHQLFNLGADLATPQDAAAAWVVRMDAATVAWLEQTIDAMTADLPPLRHFILPGGAVTAAQLHLARTICRRAERLAVTLAAQEPIGQHVLPYLNRLSDWLFVAARWENQHVGIDETRWTVR